MKRKTVSIYNSIRKHFALIFAWGMLLLMCTGWWGFLYPQLALNKDTCIIYDANGRELSFEEAERLLGEDIYRKVLDADVEKIRFRLKIVEEIREYLNRTRRE